MKANKPGPKEVYRQPIFFSASGKNMRTFLSFFLEIAVAIWPRRRLVSPT